MTEFVEFASRLYSGGLYEHGLRISLNLVNTENRQLWISESSRMPFFNEKKTGVQTIKLARDLSPEVLDTQQHPEVSVSIVLELFDHFGWNPDPSQIQADQTKFYRKDW